MRKRYRDRCSHRDLKKNVETENERINKRK